MNPNVSILIFVIAQNYISLGVHSIFLHRYAAHRQFYLSEKGIRRGYFLSWLLMGPSYLTAWVYGVMHRMHHAYADTKLDPHSPTYSKNVFVMMWRTRNIYQDIWHGRCATVNNDPAFTKDLPQWKKFDDFASHWGSRLAWAGIYLGLYVWIHPSWYMYLFLPLQWIINPFHGVIVNWYAHKYGERPNKMDNTSCNLPAPLALTVPGECYHNNHHKNPNLQRFGKWDIYYFVMRTLRLKFREQ